MNDQLIHIFLLIPLGGFILSLFLPAVKERLVSGAAFATTFLHFCFSIIFLIIWLFNGHPALNIKDLILFKSPGYEFFIDFYFDGITAVYLIVGSFLSFMVSVYSRYYMHREQGYKRFFNTILFFFLGYNVTIFSGNLETLFIGWEILGICSFLLIAFYRDRYFPVRNAMKVFSIYRIGDVGLILAMWLMHHLWHENITFQKLENYQLVHEELQTHSIIGAIISILILITASAKSAQFPFSSWLPRAMEGPTPSSAIFYGSLSVHIGVFLLLRTFPFWEQQITARVLIGAIGLLTSIIASSTAQVQSSVKSQIAYASITQIGLIFIELACGLKNLALFHFAGNAFLRTYQLLVSPSVVSYLIRQQFYSALPDKKTIYERLPQKIQNSLYILSVKEWDLDWLINQILFKPLKWVGKRFAFLTLKNTLIWIGILYIICTGALLIELNIPSGLHRYLPGLFSFIGLLLVLKSFAERASVNKAWLLIMMNHLWIVLAILFNEKFDLGQAILYLSGIIVAGVAGFFCINWLGKKEARIDLNRFQGHAYEYPKTSFVFLLCCLGITGFPITTTFIGEDLVFSHIHENQIALACFSSLSLIIDGISAMRIYSKLFLGPHIKTYHEMPFRSS